jgi:hypothetical protein
MYYKTVHSALDITRVLHLLLDVEHPISNLVLVQLLPLSSDFWLARAELKEHQVAAIHTHGHKRARPHSTFASATCKRLCTLSKHVHTHTCTRTHTHTRVPTTELAPMNTLTHFPDVHAAKGRILPPVPVNRASPSIPYHASGRVAEGTLWVLKSIIAWPCTHIYAHIHCWKGR